MALSLKPERIKRYKDVVALFIKYGRSDLVQQTDLEMTGNGHGQALVTTVERKADELASDLEQLGPTFIKLAQLMSTRGDLLPEPNLDWRPRLPDRLRPVWFDS